MNHHSLTKAAAAALAAGSPVARFDDDPIARLASAFEQHSAAISGHFDTIGANVEALATRMNNFESRTPARPAVARMQGPASTGPRDGEQRISTWGAQVSRSEDLRRLDSPSGRLRMEVRNITSDPASAGGLVRPDRDGDIAMLPHRRLTVRALLGQGETSSNSVEFMRQTGFANNAAPIAEGQPKPKSELTFDLEDAKVRTIPHYVKASRQILQDVPLLRSTIDGELRYGVDVIEEDQLLNGNGIGQNLLGLIPQATPYDQSRNKLGDTRFDTILHAIEQSEIADLPASGAIVNTSDWFAMIGIKDGDGKYISGGPLVNVPERIWRLPIVWTNAMAKGKFLVGNFSMAATIWDRQETTVELGYENDDFTRNLVTILAEKRLAMGVKRPEALITGSFVN